VLQDTSKAISPTFTDQLDLPWCSSSTTNSNNGLQTLPIDIFSLALFSFMLFICSLNQEIIIFFENIESNGIVLSFYHD